MDSPKRKEQIRAGCRQLIEGPKSAQAVRGRVPPMGLDVDLEIELARIELRLADQRPKMRPCCPLLVGLDPPATDAELAEALADVHQEIREAVRARFDNAARGIFAQELARLEDGQQ